jgi:hypothetical protein
MAVLSAEFPVPLHLAEHGLEALTIRTPPAPPAPESSSMGGGGGGGSAKVGVVAIGAVAMGAGTSFAPLSFQHTRPPMAAMSAITATM